MDGLSRYGGAATTGAVSPAGETEDLRRAHETIEELQRENAKSQSYIMQYENRIKDLENEVNAINEWIS